MFAWRPYFKNARKTKARTKLLGKNALTRKHSTLAHLNQTLPIQIPSVTALSRQNQLSPTDVFAQIENIMATEADRYRVNKSSDLKAGNFIICLIILIFNCY